jgi:hypothetical protein
MLQSPGGRLREICERIAIIQLTPAIMFTPPEGMNSNENP